MPISPAISREVTQVFRKIGAWVKQGVYFGRGEGNIKFYLRWLVESGDGHDDSWSRMNLFVNVIILKRYSCTLSRLYGLLPFGSRSKGPPHTRF